MSTVAGGLLPIFALIGLGYGLRCARLVDRGAWVGLERLIYFVFFPALLVHRLAAADFAALALGPLALAVVLAVLAVSTLAAALRRPLALDGPRHAVVFMAASRFNTYVGIAAAETLWGSAGTATAAIILAVWVPLVNVLSVIVLLRHGERPWTGTVPARVVREVAGNPIILAVSARCGDRVERHRSALVAGPAAGTVGGRGAAARPAHGRRRPRVRGARHSAAARSRSRSAAKLALMPAVMLAATALVGLDARAAAIVVLFAALPASPAAYVMTRQLGGDGPLMAGTIAATTVVSAVSLPAWIAIAA